LKGSNIVRPVLIGIGLFTVLSLINHMHGTLTGNWTLVAQEVTKYWVALAALGLTFYMFSYYMGSHGRDSSKRDAGALALQIGLGAAGVIMSDVLYRLNTNGIIVDELITGSITVTDLMVVNCLVWIIMGLIAGGFY